MKGFAALLHSVTKRIGIHYLTWIDFPEQDRFRKAWIKMVFFKILLVALSLLVQDKAFSDRTDPISEMDTLDFSIDNPERLLARRAMESQGLCPVAVPGAGSGLPEIRDSGAHAGPDRDPPAVRDADGDMAAVCF